MPETTTALSDEVKVAVVLGTLLLMMLAVWVFTFLVIYRRRQQQYRRDKELLLTQFEQEMQLAQLEVQEHTQRQIASEIHDNVGQLLSVVRLYQSGLAAQLTDAAQRNRLNEANAITGQAITDLRALSHSLNSDQLALHSLADSLRTETERITRSGQLTAAFVADCTLPLLPPDTTLMLFRMVQELLHNAIRHAAATHIAVSAAREQTHFRITVADNGTGLPEQPATPAGSGLRNLRRRATLIGATLHYATTVGGGTTVTITFPMP